MSDMLSPNVKAIHANKGIQVLKLENMNLLSPKFAIQSDAPINTTENAYVIIAKCSDEMNESDLINMANQMADSM